MQSTLRSEMHCAVDSEVLCSVYSAQCTVCSVQCAVYSVQFTVQCRVQYTVQSALSTAFTISSVMTPLAAGRNNMTAAASACWTLHSTLYSVQCTLYSVHYTVYGVQCSVVHHPFITVQCMVTQFYGCSRQCGRPVGARCSMGLGRIPLINGLIQHTHSGL